MQKDLLYYASYPTAQRVTECKKKTDQVPKAERSEVPGSALRLVKGAPTDPDALLSGIRFLGFAVSLHGWSEQFELVEGTSSH